MQVTCTWWILTSKRSVSTPLPPPRPRLTEPRQGRKQLGGGSHVMEGVAGSEFRPSLTLPCSAPDSPYSGANGDSCGQARGTLGLSSGTSFPSLVLLLPPGEGLRLDRSQYFCWSFRSWLSTAMDPDPMSRLVPIPSIESTYAQWIYTLLEQ